MVSIITNPVRKLRNSISITPMSKESLGHVGRVQSSVILASTTWPANNRAILVPFRIRIPLTVASLFVLNGAAVSGNFDIGIYDDGNGSNTVNRLTSLGSTAQAGTSVIQQAAKAITLASGNYYMAMVMDNTTGAVLAKVPGGSTAAVLAGFGCAQAALGSVVLPATITLATMASALLPAFGLSQKATM